MGKTLDKTLCPQNSSGHPCLSVGNPLDTTNCPQNIPGNLLYQWGIPWTHLLSSEYPEKKKPFSQWESPEQHLLSLQYPGKSPSLGASPWTPPTVFRLSWEIPFCPRGIPQTPCSAIRMSQETPFCQWGDPWTSNSYQRMSQETSFCQWGIPRAPTSVLRISRELPCVRGKSPGHCILTTKHPRKPPLSVGNLPDTIFCPQ